jgi:hypothetical protein
MTTRRVSAPKQPLEAAELSIAYWEQVEQAVTRTVEYLKYLV